MKILRTGNDVRRAFQEVLDQPRFGNYHIEKPKLYALMRLVGWRGKNIAPQSVTKRATDD